MFQLAQGEVARTAETDPGGEHSVGSDLVDKLAQQRHKDDGSQIY